ncbi:hypothetical protein GCM10009030_05560 [Haloarcula pellucida]|uniref:Uncharacterized protein n=1 Tax=Haloarcula pellucida TaxID=1427151 RepID=A0A830GGU4_9EURY|nr:hypothetical protein GCM10009030_05560 [Halomicroarcula pellucida]
MVAEGQELGNPNIPVNEGVLEAAVGQIRADGHESAWEVIDGRALSPQAVQSTLSNRLDSSIGQRGVRFGNWGVRTVRGLPDPT